MSLKIKVEDRIPTYPGRVVLTPVAGAENTFDMTRADLPVNPGTPINKVLFDSKADRVTEDVTVYVSQNGSDITGTGENLNPFKTIQAAIDSIPKSLDGNTVIVDIGNGEYDENVVCRGFTGGKLVIGVLGRICTISGLEVDSCSFVEVNLYEIKHGTVSPNTALLNVTGGSVVSVPRDIMIDGGYNNISGVQASLGSTVCFGYGFELSVAYCNTAAVVSTSGSRISLSTVTGGYNSFGLTATMGGTITHGLNTLDSSFGDNEQDGGRIFSN